VFVDGVYAADLSAVDDLQEDTLVGSLAQNCRNFCPRLVTILLNNRAAKVFTALNTSSVMIDGAIVWIPKDQIIIGPFICCFDRLEQSNFF
jgi:Fe-S cluster assembly protein SufD